MLKNAFLYRVALHDLKKQPFSAKQENFIASKLYELYSKPFFTHKNFFCTCLSSLSAKNSHFHKPKAFFRTSLSLLLSKAVLFHPPLPLPTTLNLLSAKNTAVLLLFALILCCKARTSHRFKSLPAIPGEVAAFRKTGYLMKAGHFRFQNVSTGDLNRPRSPEVRKPLACFLVLCARRKKNVKTSPLQEAPRFRKPRISAQR